MDNLQIEKRIQFTTVSSIFYMYSITLSRPMDFVPVMINV
jgi:hypothetical protein